MLPGYLQLSIKKTARGAAAIIVTSVVTSIASNIVASSATAATSPSTTVDSYVQSHLPNVITESILTVGDGSFPKTGGGSTQLVGIPDGMAVIDGSELTPAEPDYFYLLVNHELSSVQGVARDHGNAGAFVSKWKVNKATHEVVEGDDLIKQTYLWDESTSTFVAGSVTFDRLCSADRPAPSALFNSASGKGSQEIIYMNGEETSGGRAFAHVITGADAGNSYHLAHLGYAAFENVLLSPYEQDKTVAILTDDASNGELYIYVGEKTSTGNDVEKAGLVGGDLYALAVVGKPYELDQDLSSAVGHSESFTLKLIGTDGDRPINGSDTEGRGADVLTPVDPAQTFESLKMGGPEDGAWDTRPGREGLFYFVTKGTSSNGITAPTRIWQLAFDDIANPSAGGTLSLLKDGPEMRLGSLDNVTFEVVNGKGKFYIQEDLGGDSRLSKIWEYDLDSGRFEEIAQHSAERFFDGGSDFLTTNEESSGIISLKNVLGEGWFAASVQVHTSAGLSNTAELVENGQLVLLNIDNRGSDLSREPVISSGAAWDYRVDGVDPGAAWNDVGFVPDASWNVDTTGIPTGSAISILGYGESAGYLTTDLLQPPSPRAAAYYFRNEFDLVDPSSIILFDLYMKVDDGAVVYINDVEVARYNMDDTAVDNNTFAAVNEASERDWKQIAITGENIPLLTTGNVIAVSVHQENSTSSDMRMDLELIAWRASVDAGAAPTTPANLAVGGATQTSLELTWDAQTDARFFRIERQAQGADTWEVIQAEYPGSFASFVDVNVESGITYNYRLWAVNIYGRSALSSMASGATQVSVTPIVFEENFDVPDSFGQFTALDVAGADRNWSWVLWDFGSTGAAQGNGYGGSGATEDWLITTNPLNFLFFQNETLEYDSQISFSGPTPQVLWSSDYDPGSADPNAATWTLINEDTSAFGSLTKVGPFDISGIPDTAYLAFKYESLGGAGGQSTRFTVDDVIVKADCGFDFVGAENTDVEADSNNPWQVVNLNSEFGWQYDDRAGQQGAVNNNFSSPAGGIQGGTASDDWLISPPIFASGQTGIDFEYYENYGDTLTQPLSVLVTENYTGDPLTTVWTDITPTGLNGSTADSWIPVSSSSFNTSGEVRVAFRYESAGNGGGTTKRIGVDQVCVVARGGPLDAGFSFNRSGAQISFIPAVSGGTPPYSYAWDFGNGETSSEEAPVYTYSAGGTYTVTLNVSDDEGETISTIQTDALTITEFSVPPIESLRVASFNASMNRPSAGQLATALAAGNDAQIAAVAEVIQRANPDILLLNEFDQVYDSLGEFDRFATEQSVRDFIANYLEVAQADDVDPVSYAYFFVSPSNTGVPSGFDFNNDGDTTDPEDAYGFGEFAGQYGFVILSKHRIVQGAARTFQNFLWKDMPRAYLPPDPNDSDGDGSTTSYFSKAELDVYRLSSKTHVDVPVYVRGVGLVHILASHPTPPVFDDGTATTYPSTSVVDWNGLRNHDEIRFWADYIDPAKNAYIYDDREWAAAGNATPEHKRGGLPRNQRFIILGDQNADPLDGDATFNPANLLLGSSLVNTSITPSSAGALEQVPNGSERETKTSSFNLRADYALPSQTGFSLRNAWVFWPLTTDKEANLLNASDHRMVVIDLDR